MIDETKGPRVAREQVEATMLAFKAGAVARAEAKMLAAMEAGTYMPMPAAPTVAPTVAPERLTRAQVDADWRRRDTQPWPSGCADRFQGRAVFGLGWRS
jgi:hypothetical protein